MAIGPAHATPRHRPGKRRVPEGGAEPRVPSSTSVLQGGVLRGQGFGPLSEGRQPAAQGIPFSSTAMSRAAAGLAAPRWTRMARYESVAMSTTRTRAAAFFIVSRAP